MRDRRIGIFRISTDIIEEKPELVKRIMGECIILKAEYEFYSDCIVYTAISNWFDKVKIGCIPMEYSFRFVGNKWMFTLGESNEYIMEQKI